MSDWLAFCHRGWLVCLCYNADRQAFDSLAFCVWWGDGAVVILHPKKAVPNL